MQLSLEEVSDRLVEMGLLRRGRHQSTGQVIECSQGCMLGISRHAEDGTALAFMLYPQHRERAMQRRIKAMLVERFADADNVDIHQAIGEVRALATPVMGSI